MSLRTIAEIKTAQWAGGAVLDMQITDAFPNGSSVMERMIAGTEVTNWMRTVLHVKKMATSGVKIEDAFPKSGLATFQTIVAMLQTRMMTCALETTGSALNQSSNVTTTSVFQEDGLVIMMTIAAMDRMKLTAKIKCAQPINSNVTLGTVSKRISNVTESETVWVCNRAKDTTIVQLFDQ